MVGKRDRRSNLANVPLHYVAVTAATVLLGGCAGMGASVAPVREAQVGRPPLAAVSNPVVLHDPLAEIGSLDTDSQPGYSYQRFVTTRLDRLSEFWNRRLSSDWSDWSDSVLQDGDIVFVQSEGNLIMGVIDFSKLTREVTDSPFTHMGMIAIENGQAMVYDTVVAGPGRKTFGQLMALPDVRGVAVKRLRPEYRQHIPGALAYCRRVHQLQIGFDKKLRLDNDELYCSELVELAYRSTGLQLSQPVRWDALPGFEEDSIPINAIRLASQAQPSDYVVVPGNDRLGIWASPVLELVLDLTGAASPPAPNPADEIRGGSPSALSSVPAPQRRD